MIILARKDNPEEQITVYPVDAREILQGSDDYVVVEAPKGMAEAVKRPDKPRAAAIPVDSMGMATIKHKDGRTRRCFPIDAREQMQLDRDWSLVGADIPAEEVPVEVPASAELVKAEVAAAVEGAFDEDDVHEPPKEDKPRRGRKRSTAKK